MAEGELETLEERKLSCTGTKSTSGQTYARADEAKKETLI